MLIKQVALPRACARGGQMLMLSGVLVLTGEDDDELELRL